MNNWIKWNGGYCPVDGDVMVEVEFRCGDSEYRKATHTDWKHDWDEYDVIAYRVVVDKDTSTKSIDSLIDDLNAAQAELSDIEKRKQDVEKRINSIMSQIESEIEEKTGLKCELGDGGIGLPSPEECAPVYDNKKQDIPEGVDVDDPATWKDGDIIECIETIDYYPVTIGHEYAFSGYGLDWLDCVDIKEDDNGDKNGFHIDYTKFRFVRRG